MKRCLLLALALVVGGCSLILKPDRDAIIPDLDAGPDAHLPDGGDAGDAGDAGCIPEQTFETSCNDEIDNDCDSIVDCDELECGASGFCCAVDGGGVWREVPSNFLSWRDNRDNVGGTATSVVFGNASLPGSLSIPDCAPLAFGMRFGLTFHGDAGPTSGYFASFLLAPVSDPGGGPFLADFRLRVDDEGRARAERAGALIGEAMIGVGEDKDATIDLTPGVDEAGRAVLFVSVQIDGVWLAVDYPLMPLSDLRGQSVMCTPDGLFVALEGRGDTVRITGALSARTRGCDSPTQFIDDSGGPLRAMVDELEPGTWRAGGLGEPTFMHVGVSALATERVEFLCDTSTDERSDEIFRFIDFSIGGAFREGSSWTPRNPISGPQLLGPDPSSREPSIFVPNMGGVTTGAAALVAYSREADLSHQFEIALTTVPEGSAGAIVEGYPVLTPAQVTDCDSLRDPSLIALRPNPQMAGLLLFFTCEPTGSGPAWIGAAHLTYSRGMYEMDQVYPWLLTSAVGDYALQGAFSPEVIITKRNDDESLELRAWFLARSNSGRVRVAFAYGEVEVGGAPSLSPFGGNPVLDPEDPILGSTCPLGCTIDSLGVMRTTDARDFWDPPSYVFLIERSVFLPGGVDHQLIPLRQPRPNDG